MPAARCSWFHLPRIIAVVVAALAIGSGTRATETVTVGNLVFVNKALVGVGRLPASLRDKFGETFGSGSGIAVDLKSWMRTADGYQGTFYMLPDRGFNVGGTIDYRARINKLAVTFKPLDDPDAVPLADRQTSIAATLVDTILLTDAEGETLTGLDPTGIRVAANGLPDLPQAANGRISIDTESLALLPDGSFFIGDEYGPYVYRFSPTGRLLAAIRPPEALVPKREGKDNFSSNNPGPGAPVAAPSDPETGRQNNQGFEGLTLTPPRGRFLVAALQSATRQDGGAAPQTRRYARLLYYDIADLDHPKLAREHVIPLPMFENARGQQRVAAQSELLALDETFFLLLCRDAGNGYGAEGAISRYRSIELLDTAGATNIAGSPYDGTVPVAPDGKLAKGVKPATLTRYIDINDNVELRKFGLHNGEPNDRNDLSEKWEGMTLVPALDPDSPNDYFLFISNDNDFITRNGYQAGAAYGDARGREVDTMLLAYRITLPEPVK
ncbi:MAG TPA: esterase-like activity of phytase family protein [Xanthobacteraceae bacterium]|jgi:hypothetical protein